MKLETRTLYINGTHYVRIPATMAKQLGMKKTKNYNALFTQDEIYNDTEYVFELKEETKEGIKK